MYGQTSRAYQMLVDAYRVVLQRMHLKNLVLPAAMIAALCGGGRVQAQEASGPTGPDGLYTHTHTVDPGGVFAGPGSTTTRTLGRQKMLLMYFHQASSPDMYSAFEGAGDSGTWYNLLARNADSLRSYYAAMSGGKMDFDVQIVDVPVTPKADGTVWATADAQTEFLPNQGIHADDYQYRACYYQPWVRTVVDNPAADSGVAGLGDMGAPGMVLQDSWFVYTDPGTFIHETGHNLSLNHTRSLGVSTSLPSYVYNHTSGDYEAAPASSGPINLPIGAKWTPYGSPYSVMGGGQGMTPRQKQSMGWMDAARFANVNALVAPNDNRTLQLYDDMVDMPVVVSTASGASAKYGVAHGYRDVYYNASITRQAQGFHFDSTNTGHWEVATQKFDFYYRSGLGTVPGYADNSEAPGLVVDLNGMYIGRLAVGQTFLEKDVGHTLFGVDTDVRGGYNLNDLKGSKSSVQTDLLTYTIGNRPQDPARYRSTWYKVTYLGEGSDGNGHFANVKFESIAGAQVIGWQFDGNGATAGAQDGSGTWTAGGGNNWRSVSQSTDNQNWTQDEDAVFGAGGAAGTVTLNGGAVTANSIAFKSVAGAGRYTLTNGTLSLTYGGIVAEESATIAATVRVAQNQFWTISKDKTLTVSGTVNTSVAVGSAARKGVRKDGQGTLVLDGVNTWNSDLNIVEGVVRQEKSQSFVGENFSGTTYVTSLRINEGATYQVVGGTLRLSGRWAEANGLSSPTMSTIHTVDDANPALGTLRLSSTTATQAAPELQLDGGSASMGSIIRTHVLLDEGTHFIAVDGRGEINGNITGTGGITLSVGTASRDKYLRLGGRVAEDSVNTFSGDIEIRAGSLHVIGKTSLQGNNVLRFNTSSANDPSCFYLHGFDRSVRNLSSGGTGMALIANAQGTSFFGNAIEGATVAANLTVTQDSNGIFSGVMADTYAGYTGAIGTAAALGLVKKGAATLTLTGASTNTGVTTISEGTLQIGNGGTTGSLGTGAIVNNASLVYNRSNNFTVSNLISGTGTLTKAGGGMLTQTGADTRTGATLVNGGILRGGTNNAFSASSAYTLADVAVARLDLNGTSQTIGALSGGGALGGNVTLGAGTLAVGAKNVDASYAGVISGTGSLVKTGTAVQTLTRAQTYGGGTTVNNGTLRLDFSGGATSGILSASGTLTLGGGTLEVKGNTGSLNIQSVNGTTLSANTSSALQLTQNNATLVNLRLGTVHVGAGAVVDFQGGTGATGAARFSVAGVDGAYTVDAAQLATVNKRLGAFATWNGTDWAASSGVSDGAGGYFLQAYTGYTNLYNGTGGGTTVIQNVPTADVRINEASSNWTHNTLQATAVTVNSLMMSASGPTAHTATVDLAGGTLTVGDGAGAAGAIAVGSDAKSLTVGVAGANAGILTSGTSGASTLGLISSNAAAVDGMFVNAVIANGGTGTTALTVSGGTGGGTVVLAGNNTYTGGTSVTSGATLQVGAGSATGTLGGGGVSLDTDTRLVFNRNDAGLTVSSAISGGGAVTQNGAGTTTLSGTNTYTGATTILAGGTLRIGANGLTGTLGTADVANAGTLAFNRSDTAIVSNAISGTGTVAQVGGGTTILTGTNNYGATTVSDGTLQIGNDAAAGTLGSGAVSVASGATLAFNRSDAITVSNALSGAGAFSKNNSNTLIYTGTDSRTGTTAVNAGMLQIGNGAATGTLGSGAVSVSSGATLAFHRSDTVTVSGAISGAGTLLQSGTGTTVLSGANGYGATRVTGGILQIANGGRLGTGNVALDGGTLDFHQSGALSVSQVISGMGGVTQTGAGTTTLLGNNTYNGPTRIDSGVLQVGNGGTAGRIGSGSVDNDGQLVFNRSGTLRVVATISGAGTVRHAGSGTVVLTASNTYTGGTTIDGGTLQLGEDKDTGTVGSGNVVNNGTLAFQRHSALTFSNGISGSGHLVQRGLATTRLSGAVSYAGTTTVSAGTLALDYSANSAGKLSDTAALLLAGGTLNLVNGSHTEIVGSTTLQSGYSRVTRSAGSGILRMNAITVSDGAVVSFGASGIATTDTLNTNGILGPWATIGDNWAMNSTNAADGLITTYTAYTDVTRLSSGTKAIAHGPSAQVRIVEGTGTAANIMLGAATTTTINTLNQSSVGGTSAATIAFSAGQILEVNGILAGAGTGALTIGSAATPGVLKSASAGGDLLFTNNASNAATVYSVIADNAGASSFSKNGTGTVVLRGASTYSGGTTISQGELTGSSAATAGAKTVFGSGTVTANAGATVRIYSASTTNAQSHANDFALNGATFISEDAVVTYGGDFALTGANTLQVVLAGKNAFITGDISGAGGLSKTGSGALILSGTNAYAGNTAVWRGGILRVDGIHAAGTGTYTVNSGGKLGGIGTIATTGAVTVVSGGQITGADLGTVGDLTINATQVDLQGTYLFDVNYAAASGAGDADTLFFSGAGSTVDFNGFAMQLNTGAGTGNADYSIKLMEWTGTTANLSVASGGIFSATGLSAGQSVVRRGNAFYLEMGVVPEPASAALLGLGSLLLLRRPTRRKK